MVDTLQGLTRWATNGLQWRSRTRPSSPEPQPASPEDEPHLL